MYPPSPPNKQKKKKMHHKVRSSYPARITSGWLLVALALKEKSVKCPLVLIFKKHLSIDMNEEPDINLNIRFPGKSLERGCWISFNTLPFIITVARIKQHSLFLEFNTRMFSLSYLPVVQI